MLLKVIVNGQSFVVDAPNKASAKSFGKKKLDIKVEELSLADLQNLDVSTVEKVEVEAKPAADAAVATDTTAANAETAAAAGDSTNY